MRFKKGNKVEVFSSKEVPSGSWRCAEIICGNGHNYTVSYETFKGSSNGAVVERLPRKAIRPLPPVLVSGGWVSCDVIEIYDNLSWKIGTVLKVLERGYYLVRLVGSTEEFRVHESDIRARQYWTDEKWVVIGKGSGNCQDRNFDKNITLRSSRNSSTGLINTQLKLSANNDCLQHKVPDSQNISSRMLKRGSPYGSSQVEAHTRPAKKHRGIENEKDEMCYKGAGVNTFSSREKVDAIAYPQEMLGKKYTRAANNTIYGISDMHVERRVTVGIGSSTVLNVSTTDDDRITCSVGSCSVTSTGYHRLPLAVTVHNSDNYLSDAESVCLLECEENNNLPTTREELREEVHNLELHAYRRTIKALHAAGPLSWEQEVMLTNLRDFLNISNEEHLMEVRKLVSSANSFHIS